MSNIQQNQSLNQSQGRPEQPDISIPIKSKNTVSTESANSASEAILKQLSGSEKLMDAAKAFMKEVSKQSREKVMDSFSQTHSQTAQTSSAEVKQQILQQPPALQTLAKKLEHQKKTAQKQIAVSEQTDAQNIETQADESAVAKAKQTKKKKETQATKKQSAKSAAKQPDSPLHQTISKYVGAFTANLYQEKTKQKSKLAPLKQKLSQDGLSEKEINYIEKQVLKTAQKNLKKQLKTAAIERLLTTYDGSTKSDRKISQHMFAGLGFTANIGSQLKLANKHKTQQLSTMAEKDATQESTVFVKAQLQETLQKKFRQLAINDHHSDPNASRDELAQELTELKTLSKALNLNYDREEQIAKIMAYDLGYMLFEQGQSDQQQSDQPQEFVYETDDEQDIMLDRIRAIYLTRAVNGDFKTRIDTMFSLRKLENGAMQLGIYNKDVEERLKKEAKVLGIEKLQDMLDEALMERATFFSMSGVTFKLNQTKIKTVIKNLAKLDSPISESQFKTRQDTINKKMAPSIVQELSQLSMKEKQYPHISELKTRKTQLLQVLDRLKKETPLLTHIDPEITEDLSYLEEGLNRLEIDA